MCTEAWRVRSGILLSGGRRCGDEEGDIAGSCGLDEQVNSKAQWVLRGLIVPVEDAIIIAADFSNPHGDCHLCASYIGQLI